MRYEQEQDTGDREDSITRRIREAAEAATYRLLGEAEARMSAMWQDATACNKVVSADPPMADKRKGQFAF